MKRAEPRQTAPAAGVPAHRPRADPRRPLKIRNGALQFAEHAPLHGFEPRPRRGAISLGLGNGGTIAIENRQGEADTQRPSLRALVPRIARPEMKIGILPCDFEAEIRLGRIVIRKRDEDVRPHLQRQSLQFIRGWHARGSRRLDHATENPSHALGERASGTPMVCASPTRASCCCLRPSAPYPGC